MISKFGQCMREIREKNNESLRQMAIKLGKSAAFLSAMEVGRKTIPLEYVELISNLYNLSFDEKIKLEDSINYTNSRVSIELNEMSEVQKDISIMFARKIKNADSNLLERLKEALANEEN